jgi:hypothetical protein
MQPRRRSAEAQLGIRVRKIIGPFMPELGRLNEEAARLSAHLGRPDLTASEGAVLLLRAAQAGAALSRIERQLEGVLRAAPSEAAAHGRVRKLHAAIAALRAQFAALGAFDAADNRSSPPQPPRDRHPAAGQQGDAPG